MRYPGGKGQAGVYQLIINSMPAHEVYIETHVGGGNILERKKPASCSIAIDADAEIIDAWQRRGMASTTFICGDACDRLLALDWEVLCGRGGKRVLIYADPPYLETKTRQRYRHQYPEAKHIELLRVLSQVPAWVMLSGYRNAIYDDALRRWYRRDFQVLTRGHTWATESLWCNFEPPAVLHDYQYLGENFRERERIKRQQKRWRARLSRLPADERAAMMEILRELASSETAVRSASSEMALRDPARALLAISGDASWSRPTTPEKTMLEHEKC